ncbi:hypothetical protein RAS1_04280 [Phycisphaerae bacterium RAS1]|nr:hypothetical protein RAS1_04280 [Phycisphaerae bacterium RAS1]
MAEQERKIIVDDDWKAQARREKEQLSAGEQGQGHEQTPAASFAELLNLIAVQALAGLGALAGPGGERIPPNLEIAKHFIDMLQVLDEKTKNNLTPPERQLLDQVLYEMRMRYVQMASAAHPGLGGAAAPQML